MYLPIFLNIMANLVANSANFMILIVNYFISIFWLVIGFTNSKAELESTRSHAEDHWTFMSKLKNLIVALIYLQ